MNPIVAQLLLELLKVWNNASTAAKAEGQDLEALVSAAISENGRSIYDVLHIQRPPD